MQDISIQKTADVLNVNLQKQQPVRTQGQSFQQILKNSLQEANDLQLQANNAIQQLTSGNRENIHETMIAIEKANISFQLIMQVRNKILDAYQEIMRMPL